MTRLWRTTGLGHFSSVHRAGRQASDRFLALRKLGTGIEVPGRSGDSTVVGIGKEGEGRRVSHPFPKPQETSPIDVSRQCRPGFKANNSIRLNKAQRPHLFMVCNTLPCSLDQSSQITDGSVVSMCPALF